MDFDAVGGAALAARQVFFGDEGEKLAGTLIHRAGRHAHAQGPAAILVGPLAVPRQWLLPRFGTALAMNGFTVLSFDHRNFGGSEGEPRQHLVPADQLADVRAALAFMRHRSDVDPSRLALVGFGLGAAYCLTVTQQGEEVAWLAAIGGMFDPSAVYSRLCCTGHHAGALTSVAFMSAACHPAADLDYLPVVEPDVGARGQVQLAALPGASAASNYLGLRKMAAAMWPNRITAIGMRALMNWDPGLGALPLTVPLLLVHGGQDDLAPAAVARHIYDQAKGVKRVAWFEDAQHGDFLASEPLVGEAVAELCSWLHEQAALPPGASIGLA